MDRVCLAIVASSLALAGCNAVFGLEDVSFGSGGGGGGGGGDASTSTGAGDCSFVDVVSNGDFEDGLTDWDHFLSVEPSIEPCDVSDCVHVVDETQSGNFDNNLEGSSLCPGQTRCVELSFRARANESLSTAVVLLSFTGAQRKALIDEFTLEPAATFEAMGAGCRVPDELDSLDDLSFTFQDSVDFFLDDVTLAVSSCDETVEPCFLFPLDP